jgi:hypothetical protein
VSRTPSSTLRRQVAQVVDAAAVVSMRLRRM